MPATDPAPSPAAQAALCDWIRLERARGVGPEDVRVLAAVFGAAPAILGAGIDALTKVLGRAKARAVCAPLAPDDERLLERVLAWCAQPNHRVLALTDSAYPAALRHLYDPPTLLYVIGQAALLARPALAVVGSRNASAQGAANAASFGQALSDAGLTIVSGLALGVDAAAHAGALRGAGSTVAVIGTGADLVYPYGNRALHAQIAEQGCIVSEYALGMPALPGHFPRRNRIISGLALGVLVVEAAPGSGSLITARCALEQGREVFAIPGSIHSPLAKGCHALIKQGAKLVETSADVLEELQLGRRTAPDGDAPDAVVASSDGAPPNIVVASSDGAPPNIAVAGTDADAAEPGAAASDSVVAGSDGAEPHSAVAATDADAAKPGVAASGAASTCAKAAPHPVAKTAGAAGAGMGAPRTAAGPAGARAALLLALGHDPHSVDTLAARTGMGAGELMTHLLALELAGSVERLPGGRYQCLTG